MSHQNEVITEHEARIAELEQQLAALQRARPVARSQLSRRRLAAVGVVLALLAVPAVALASHQFPDVPTGHPFHNQISAIAKAGITAGFSDGGYHPSDPVTRQAMAAFMERGFGRVGLAVNTAPTTGSVDVAAGWSYSVFVPVRELTITVPGQTNSVTPNQLVRLQGHVEFFTTMSAAKGCPCLFTAVIQDAATGATSPSQSQTFVATDFTSSYSFEVEALMAAPPGPRTYRLWVGLDARPSTTNAAVFNLHTRTSLSAMTFPFGPTGSNTASAPGAANEPADVDQLPERR